MQIAPTPSSTSTWEEDAVKDRVVREKIKADLLDDRVEYTREEEEALRDQDDKVRDAHAPSGSVHVLRQQAPYHIWQGGV